MFVICVSLMYFVLPWCGYLCSHRVPHTHPLLYQHLVQLLLAVRITSFLPMFVVLKRIVDSMSSRTSYDNTGNAYNVSQIINADVSFNITAYEQYSPLFLPWVV